MGKLKNLEEIVFKVGELRNCSDTESVYDFEAEFENYLNYCKNFNNYKIIVNKNSHLYDVIKIITFLNSYYQKYLPYRGAAESVLPVNMTKEEKINSIRDFLIDLQRKSKIKDVIYITDRYFCPNFKTNETKYEYLELIYEIFKELSLKKIILILPDRYNRETYQLIKQKMEQNNIILDFKIHDFFHDRFWIFSEEVGGFIGGSLNGLGVKYFLKTELCSEDSKDIYDLVINI